MHSQDITVSPFVAPSAVDRFRERVDTSGSCHVWTGPLDSDGYGRFWVGGKMVLAHRFAWTAANGPIPKGKMIRHTCPGGMTPGCVTEAHLKPGTAVDNARDRCEHGTQPRGEGSPNARLTNEQAAAIRTATGSDRELAMIYGVGKTTIRRIRKGQTYQEAA